MAILNSGLARPSGHPAIAAAALFTVALAFCVTVALASGVRSLGDLRGAPVYLFAGGIIVGFYVLSVTILAPRFGVGNAILWVMVAQVFTSAAIDHFGVLGAAVRPLSAVRTLGLVVLVVGLVTTQAGQAKGVQTFAAGHRTGGNEVPER
jgi:transporter family-2 protein